MSQPTTAGTAVVVRELVRVGVTGGHHVSVASPPGGDLPRWALESGANWVEMPLHRLPGPYDAIGVSRLRELMPRFDVVHLHSSKAGAVGRAASRLLPHRPPVVFSPHGWSWYLGGRAGKMYRALERRMAAWCDAIVAVSTEEHRDGRHVLGARAPLRLIENGVDLGHFRPGGAKGAVDALTIVTVGRLCRQKGQDRLLRAVAGLANQQIRVRLVGDGPDRVELTDLARRLGIGDRVEFLGRANPLPEYQAADLVVLPSRWEGLSLVLLEAMAAGCAIIASSAGAAHVLDGAGAIVDETGDDDAFTAALAREITWLAASPVDRRALGEAARERATARYSMERMLQQYVDLWVGLADARATSVLPRRLTGPDEPEGDAQLRQPSAAV